MKGKSFKTLLMALVSLVYITPLYILFSMSLKSPQDTSSKWVFPTYLYLKNFFNAWKQANLARSLLNNIVITMFSITLIILVGSFAAYPLGRFRTKFNNFIYLLFLSCMIVPPLTILVPLYKFIVDIHGMNSYWAITLMLVTFQLPLCVFLYTNFVAGISRELDQAAIIDGCSRFRVFYSIIFPLLKPATSSVAILCGVQVWNDYQFSVFFLQKAEIRTVSVALSQFVSQYQNDIGLVAAGCLIGILPFTLLYMFLQKYFIKGLTDGALKG